MDDHTRTIDGSEIEDFDSFHRVFKQAMGFPEFYGNNMNAWIDCMGDIHEDTGMSNVLLAANQPLNLVILNTKIFNQTCPDVLAALVEDTAFVNDERLQNQAPIRLIFHK
ncbi:barnase inhibitor [Candidatus Saccharibacteria bacterium]|nr:MAG: barnase inhibitor [Candidatus Saccharibacteria bacterium]